MKRVRTVRDEVPACPECGSRSMTVTLLTYYGVSMRCSDCHHRWTISHEAAEEVSVANPEAVSQSR